MISYLADFASRMEHISEIASVICRRNRNLAIEASFGDNELDNICSACSYYGTITYHKRSLYT